VFALQARFVAFLLKNPSSIDEGFFCLKMFCDNSSFLSNLESRNKFKMKNKRKFIDIIGGLLI
jgi:hypothetical protein